MHKLFNGKSSSIELAARELADLQEQATHVRQVLAQMQDQMLKAEAPSTVGSQAIQLLEANEQLVLSALRAQTDAEALSKALDQVSQAAELNALIDRRARESLAELNATLEARVVARTQEMEQARDEALSASRAKEQCLSNMSHEIRTPMYGMLGALELLSGTDLSPQQRQYISVASTSGEALLGVINEVLDFAKIGAGQFELAQEPIDLLEVVYRSHPSIDVFAALAAARAQRDGGAAAVAWAERALQVEPSLLGLETLLAMKAALPGDGDRTEVVLAQRLIQAQARRLSRYVCGHCGFKARQFYWQCPGCNRWDTYAPKRSEELERG